MYFEIKNNEIIATKKGNTLLKEKGMSFDDFKNHIKNNSFPARFPANLILSWRENEYIIKENITNEQKQKALKWIYENA
jgi:uncharacterized protein YcbX